MQVTERMRALGGHAKSSRQPPLKERKSAKADESAAERDVNGETVLETGATHESVAAVIVDDAASQIVAHENGNGAIAEITPDEEAAVLATVAAVLAKIEPQPAAVDDSSTPAKVVQDDDATSAAKRAILHEWENWSALNSDQLDDPNVGEYFFRHLETKRSHLLVSGTNGFELVRDLLVEVTSQNDHEQHS